MARYTGPVWKKARRLSFSILETGEELKKRTYAPGQHGPTKRIKLSNYGLQLREKQRIRNMYGINERQFANLFQKASRMGGMAGPNFLILLERRLDNVVYRMGFARTRKAARQLVNHGHLEVNGKKLDIPSAMVNPGDVISVRENARNMTCIAEALESNIANPAFVEDIVRNITQKLMQDDRITWFEVECENMESIHNHNAWARIERKK